MTPDELRKRYPSKMMDLFSAHWWEGDEEAKAVLADKYRVLAVANEDLITAHLLLGEIHAGDPEGEAKARYAKAMFRYINIGMSRFFSASSE